MISLVFEKLESGKWLELLLIKVPKVKVSPEKVAEVKVDEFEELKKKMEQIAQKMQRVPVPISNLMPKHLPTFYHK